MANIQPKTKEKTMKKNNTTTEIPQKKERAKRKFFLYVDGKGFIRLPREVGSLPSFDKGEVLCYTSRASAIYAREFFVGIRLAESIDILSKVA